MRRRVLRVITRLTVSGPSVHVVLLNRGLERMGWETLLVHGSIEPNETETDLSAIDVERLHIPSLRRSLVPADDARAFFELTRAIRRFRPDVVHTHQSKAGLLGRLAAAGVRVPVRVHTFHGTIFDGYFSERASAAFQLAERAVGRTTTRLVVLSDAQREEIERRGIADPSRVTVIPLGLDLERFRVDADAARRSLGLAADDFIIVAAGRFAPIKRLDRLLRIFRVVHDTLPRARLYILGDGPLRPDLEEQARALGLGDTVVFVGWTVSMASWYAASDVVVNSSDNEGTPLALIEAAAAGRPAVATRVGGVGDLVVDGRTGFLVAPDDEAAFADRIAALARDGALREAMGTEAQRLAGRYSDGRLVSDIAALYEELELGRGRRERTTDRRDEPTTDGSQAAAP
jgi:glycosyltransferase involved in cell wall biosynthesis